MRKFGMAVFMLMLAGAACADSAKDAVKAFAKLQARTEMGIGFNDYTIALGDANFEYKAFLDSPESKKHPEIARNLGSALGRYSDAATIWQAGIVSRSDAIHLIAAANAIVAKYPDAGRPEEAGGARMYSGGLRIAKVLPYYWADASAEVDAAKKSLSAQKQ